MGTITLIRHGQARTFENDSDQLTVIGEEQSRALGKYWIRNGAGFSEVYCGTLARQRRTAEIVGDCFVKAGLSWPEIQMTPELNEYDGNGIINRLAPMLAENNTSFHGALLAFQQNKNSPERNRYFQKMFEGVTSAWFNGEIQVEGVESWASFRSRVRSAINRIISGEGSGRRIAVFTSGGVIGLTVQTLLGAPEHKALEINWRIRNCSLTEFVFSRDRLSLDYFNSIPHLDKPSLRTFR
ncbi:MAG: histidine phosphatase family protein [Acidobacteria bacterium]|nr:histidine phosphatase family protein [Acidobacteriota bacterium]